MAEIAITSEANALATLYNGLASLYLMEESYELRGLALEKAIEYQPNDPNLLFQVAYSYSQVGYNELSLLYYNTLLHFSPEYDMALNNIGVAYSRLSMPIKSIDHHKKAFDFGNTLAASNIALGYINAGFSDEARVILEKAREQKDVHRNVGSTFSEIIDKKEKEQKQEKEALESAREQQRFLRSFGEAYFVQTPEIPDINGIWTFPDGAEVTIVQQKEAFTIEWTENKQAYGLKGNLVNRAAQIIVTAPSYRVNDETGSKLFITPDYMSINLMIKRYSKIEYKKLAKKQSETTIA
jgi:tetratricopeptide (TPR) repeat protein